MSRVARLRTESTWCLRSLLVGLSLLASGWWPNAQAAAPKVFATQGDGVSGARAVALKADGTLWYWGGNNGPRTPTRVLNLPLIVDFAGHHALDITGNVWDIGELAVLDFPSRVAGLSSVTALAAGVYHTLALRSDGTVWGWGKSDNGPANGWGQLGIGSATFDGRTGDPVQVPLPSKATSVSANATQSMAVLADGSVWAWGLLGRVPVTSTSHVDICGGLQCIKSPTLVTGIGDVTRAYPNDSNYSALKSDGSLWAWGSLLYGQTYQFNYQGFTRLNISSPVSQFGISNRNDLHIALTADGSVWTWGFTLSGYRTSPTREPSFAGAIAAFAWAGVYYVVASDGQLFSWGENVLGLIGDNTQVDRSAPTRVVGPGGVGFFNLLSDSTAIPPQSLAIDGPKNLAPNESGTFTATATFESGSVKVVNAVWAVSDSSSRIDAQGKLFVSASSAGKVLTVQASYLEAGVKVSGVFPVAVGPGSTRNSSPSISSAGANVLALRSDGTVVAWGTNNAGQIGDGTRILRSAPVQVNQLSGVVQVVVAGINGFALKADGTVWSWGYEIGSVPQRITSLSNVQKLSSGSRDRSIVVIRKDGTLAEWRLYGGVREIPLSGVTKVSSVDTHTLALRDDGTVWAWGSNTAGQLGDGSRSDRSDPQPVPNLSDVVDISAGGTTTSGPVSFAVRADGSVWAWGAQFRGALGDGILSACNGNTLDCPVQSTPSRLTSLSNVIAVASGYSHSMALRRDGAVWAWGANFFGELGDGTRVDQARPLPVPFLSAVAQVVPGIQSSYALNQDGTVVSWGRGEFGDLGDGTFVSKLSSTSVLNADGRGTLETNDWYLNLQQGSTTSVGTLPFLMRVSQDGSQYAAVITARAAEIGSVQNLFTFALAPMNMVSMAPGAGEVLKVGRATGSDKDAPIPCVLAQLSQAGQLVGVTGAQLQASIAATLAAQGTSIAILNGVNVASFPGATFYVGYGSSGNSMLSSGTNRAAVSVSGAVSCAPSPPQTGWWWNPAEPGRGFSLEVHGGNLFFTSYLYDNSGRATWLSSSGAVSLEGSLYFGRLFSFSNGQSLSGSYRSPAPISDEGAITLAFSDTAHGTLSWPGGTIPIQRFELIPGGATVPLPEYVPQAGWWWNPGESGRGFFIEWQGTSYFVSGFMYDSGGAPIWYFAEDSTADPRTIHSKWAQLGSGQTLNGPYKAPIVVNSNVGGLELSFTSQSSGVLQLPDGRTIPLTRFRF